MELLCRRHPLPDMSQVLQHDILTTFVSKDSFHAVSIHSVVPASTKLSRTHVPILHPSADWFSAASRLDPEAIYVPSISTQNDERIRTCTIIMGIDEANARTITTRSTYCPAVS